MGAAQVPGDARVLYSCGAPMKGVDLRIVHPDSARNLRGRPRRRDLALVALRHRGILQSARS